MSKISDIRKAEIKYCSEDLTYFVLNYGHIEDRDSEEVIQPFKLWDEQITALKALEGHKHSIILKARQLGISWLVLHYACWILLCHTGRSVIGLSRSENEAMELIRRAAVILRNMPELVAEKNNLPQGWGDAWFENTALTLTVHFPDKSMSVFRCFASNENAARSFTADLLIFDEWAFQQFDRQIWASAYPVINRPLSGQVIGVSTIKRGSLFEELFTGDNDFYKIFIPWYADPKRDEKWYEETKKVLGDQMQAEYPATIEEALTVPGGAFFPEVTDDSILTDEPLKGNVYTYFVMDYGLDMLAAYWINRDSLGNAQIIYEHCESNLIIGAAADTIISITRGLISNGTIKDVVQYLAPPDLWNRSQETGKSRAILFQEAGVTLTKVNNDIAAGCSALKEYLAHGLGKSKLTILRNCAPTLLKCLKKIQHDEKKPNIYANTPHDLTHSVDSVRYFSIYWTLSAEETKKDDQKAWRADQWEDYDNATEADRVLLIQKWGEPK